MDIHGVRYPQGWVSVTIRKNDLQIMESIANPDEACQMIGQMCQVIQELEDMIDSKRVLPNTVLSVNTNQQEA